MTRLLVAIIIQIVVFTQTVHDHREMKRHANIWGGRFL